MQFTAKDITTSEARLSSGQTEIQKFGSLVLFVTYLLILPSSFAQNHWQVPTSNELLHGITALTFSPDGTQIAVANTSGISLYETYTGKQRTLFRTTTHPVTALALSPDNRTLASANEDRTVNLWDTHTGAHRTRFTIPVHAVVALVFSPDSTTLAGGSFKAIHLWHLTDKHARIRTVLHGHRDMVTTLAFSPDAQTLASTSFYGTILLWNTRTYQLQNAIQAHTDSILTLAFSPDGKMLASGGYWSPDTESTIRLWDPYTAELQTTFSGHTNTVFDLAFSSDAQNESITLASAGRDRTIRLWNPYTRELIAIFEGDMHPASTLTFLPKPQSPRSTVLANVSLDNTLLLWELATARPPWDVNRDGLINISDLTFITSRFGQTSPDVNGDGIVNILDLVAVAAQIQ